MQRQLVPSLMASLLASLSAGLLSSCSAVPERPAILVSTTPPGASCVVNRLGQPIATVGPTPAIALVEPPLNDIAVTCRRSGFAEVSVPLEPRPDSTDQRHLDIVLRPLAAGIARP